MKMKGKIIGGLVIAIAAESVAFAFNYKSILKEFFPQGLHYNVELSKRSVINGFEQIKVGIVDQKSGTVYYKYIWVSKNGKFVIPTVIRVKKDGRFGLVVPPRSIGKIKVKAK